MIQNTKAQERLGWLQRAGVSALFIALMSVSAQAWSLDLDQQIQKSDQEASQILSTLGRDKNGFREPATKVAGQASHPVTLRLIKAPKAKKHAKVKKIKAKSLKQVQKKAKARRSSKKA